MIPRFVNYRLVLSRIDKGLANLTQRMPVNIFRITPPERQTGNVEPVASMGEGFLAD